MFAKFTPEQFDQFWNENKQDLTALLKELIENHIEDDFRAFEDNDPDLDIPSMQITISVSEDLKTWSYQTGDNSYTGSCYGDPFWGIGYIFRDSDPSEVASELIDDLGNAIPFE